MAQEIKLDCYTLKIKKNKVKNTDPDEFVGFEDVFLDKEVIIKDDKSEERVNDFYSFFGHYVNSFQNKFHVHKSSGKALCLDSRKTFPNKTYRIISGMLEGGGTGIVSKIKDVDDFDNAAFVVTDKHVSAIPFYYLLWIPEKGNVGLLIIQSFSTRSITDPLRAHLRQFFSKVVPGHTLIIGNYVPKKAIKEMKEKGEVNKLILRKHKLDADKTSELFPEATFSSLNTVDIEVVVKGLDKVAGLKDAISDFLSGASTQLIDIEPFEELGIDGSHETLLEFNHNGKTALAKQSNNFDLSISYYINESDIERDENKHPTYRSIHNYTLSYVRGVQQEIGISEELLIPEKIELPKEESVPSESEASINKL